MTITLSSTSGAESATTVAMATASGVAARVTSPVFSSCQAVKPMKPTSIATISAVPRRKDLSVIRETTSRRVTSSHAGC